MFLMFVVVLPSIFYGQVYCGFLCPQMVFSQASTSLAAAAMILSSLSVIGNSRRLK